MNAELCIKSVVDNTRYFDCRLEEILQTAASDMGSSRL